jgi:hypothetical protein
MNQRGRTRLIIVISMMRLPRIAYTAVALWMAYFDNDQPYRDISARCFIK